MADICAARRRKGNKECKTITFKRSSKGRKLAKPVKICRCGSQAGKFKSTAFKNKMHERFKGHGVTLKGEKAKGTCISNRTLKFVRCPKGYRGGTKISGVGLRKSKMGK